MLEWTENESYTARAPALRAEAAALRARADAHAKAVKAGAAPPEPMVAPSRQKVNPRNSLRCIVPSAVGRCAMQISSVSYSGYDDPPNTAGV